MNLGHENETLEFKESLGQLDKGLKSIISNAKQIWLWLCLLWCIRQWRC